MPWTGSSFKKHNLKLGDKQASKAAEIANAVLKRTGNEASAIRIANAAVKHGKRMKK